MAKFQIKTRKNGEFQFDLKASNGQTILTSEGYTTMASCKNGIESIRKNSSDEGRYDRKQSTNGKHYFVLKAGNSQVIGTSELYESLSGMNSGIESVKKNGQAEEIEDLTA